MFLTEKVNHDNDGKVITPADLIAPTGALTDKEKESFNQGIEKVNKDPAAARAYRLSILRKLIDKIRSL